MDKNIPVKKEVSAVAKGTKKEKSGFAKFLMSFISEDTYNVGKYLTKDIIKPSGSELIYNIITTAASIIIFGHDDGPASKTHKSNGLRTAYNSLYSGNTARTPSSRDVYSYDNVILETRGEAEAVLNGLSELIEVYHSATVADFYSLCGITGTSTDYNYGWDTIVPSGIDRTSSGYIIRLPKARPLN